MKIVKRDGRKEPVNFNKILTRVKKASKGLMFSYKSVEELAQEAISFLAEGVSTAQIDETLASIAENWSAREPNYEVVAKNIIVSRHHKEYYHDIQEMAILGLVTKELHGKWKKFELDEYIKPEWDYNFTFFGFSTLAKKYLLRYRDGTFAETPQHMYMRVAASLFDTKEEILKSYYYQANHYYTHASPTLFHAGTPLGQLASCFLLGTGDSMEELFQTIKECATISKHAGGIGLHLTNVRAKGSYIKGTGGKSNGIVPYLKVLESTANFSDQCFPGHTTVYTDQGIKNIEDLRVGDNVLNSEGDFSRTTKIMQSGSDVGGVRISVKGSFQPVEITNKHPVLVLSNQPKGFGVKNIVNRLEKGLAREEFKTAEQLVEGDYAVFPIPKFEKDIANLDVDDLYFFGLMVGDGYLCKERQSALSLSDPRLIDFAKEYLTNRGVNWFVDESRNGCVHIRWQHCMQLFYNRNSLYDQNNEKTIPGSFLHLPKDKALALVKGILDTDGCRHNEISLEMTSKGVIESVRYILMRFGVLCSGYIRDRRGNTHITKYGCEIKTNKISYVLRIPKDPAISEYLGIPTGRFTNYFVYNNSIYSRIDSIEKIRIGGNVYDVEIDVDVPEYVVGSLGVVHNGGGRRPGAFAVYLEPWHADIEDFLDACKKTGEGRNRAKDLFYALWVPDAFMQAVKDDDYWYLFCPNEEPSLLDCHGSEWERNYKTAIADGYYRKRVKARDLMHKISTLMLEEGKVYFLYKDAANAMSPQAPLGTINSSNLCAEVVLHSNNNQTAVCNLASLNLRHFDKPDYEEAIKFAVRSLDNVIDKNNYPDEKTRTSNMYLRPIGLGIQGLADYWMDKGIDWLSENADEDMHRIMGVIHETAYEESRKLGEERGIPEGCENIGAYRRNSVVLALMPTASTSQVLGNTESFEPIYQNIYRRRTGVDDFVVVNYRLVRDLQKLGLWSNLVYSSIYNNNGSVQHLDIPEELKEKYRTVFEIGPKRLIELAAIRQAYIDQSQSMNLYYENPSTTRVTKALMYAWQMGLVTGTYYTRTLPSGKAQVMEDCDSCSA